MKTETIESKYFIFRYHGLSGTGFLERKADGLSTARFVCSEGYQEYCELKRAWWESKLRFNDKCAGYFTPGKTVYNADDVMGYIGGDYSFKEVA